MNHPWSMQVSYRLDEHGWSDLDLWCNGKHYNFCVTHIFNSPLNDIAGALLLLKQGEKEVSFTLHEEPGEHVWSISEIAEQQNMLIVELRSYDDNFTVSKPAYKVIEFKVERLFFIDSFLMELNKISTQLGYPRFAKERGDDFPWETLKELQYGKPKN